MKIGFFEAEGWEKEILNKELQGLDIYFSNEWLTKENVENFKDIEILSIFVCSQIDKEVINSLPNLKFIATRSTGFDHIDVNYCKEKGIVVSNVPEYGTKTVTEWTFGLMINLMRKIYYAIDQIKETESFDLGNLRGEELFGKTLGVIGTGRIGKEIIKIAKAFGMNIIAFDVYPDEKFAQEQNIQYVSLENLLQNADIITIHVNLNSSTYHLINKENVKIIKRGAYLINTARGGIVETEALVYALKEGILKGAALDVLEEETEIKEELELLVKPELKTEEIKTLWQNHILMKMPNVLITPHNAFNSKEAVSRILATTIDNIKAFLSGNPINTVKSN
ncbi:MAG: lactate dehydrogenase [Candidatus Parcubacteria bacterium]|nr:MAG: lactate dehydrogenase [Candidatus Parcubacteria bacterium]